MTRRPNLTHDQVEQAVCMRERGLLEGVIARKLGVSIGSVSWALLREGAERPEARPLPPVPSTPVVHGRGAFVVRRFTIDEDARLLELEAQGLSISAIGKALGRRPNSVQGRLYTLARREARAEAA